jgi:Transposase DDE domain
MAGGEAWRQDAPHIGLDADTGEIVASELTRNDIDDGSQVGPLLDQIAGPVASFTGDGAYDTTDVYAVVAAHHAGAAVIVPPRSTAVASETSKTDPTPRDRHLTCIAERGCIGWQKASGYNKRSRVEATIGRFKQVIGNGLLSQTDTRQNTEVAVAIHVLNRSLACFEVATSASWTYGCTTRDIAGFTPCEVS